MKLIVALKDTVVQNATIPVRWCLHRKELEQLQQKDVKCPYMFIVVKNGGKEERYLVPMDQMLEYVQFHRPGEHTLQAVVVWHYEDNIHHMKNFLLGSRSRGEYKFDVLDPDGKLGNAAFGGSYRRLEEADELTVTVPAEFFAKEPSKFERWWVNLWFEYPAIDQCHFRKRRMVAYNPLVQPPLVLIWIVFTTLIRTFVAGILLILGIRRINFKPIVHPFKYKMDDIEKHMEVGNSVFWRSKDGKKYPWYVRILTPPFFLAFLAIFIGIGLLLNWIFPSVELISNVPRWYYPIAAIAIPIASILITAILIGILSVLKILFRTLIAKPFTSLIIKPFVNWLERNEDAWDSKARKRRQALNERKAERKRLARERQREQERLAEERKRQAEAQRQAELEELLACNGEFTPTLKALPRHKQTLYLRFKDLKVSLCKPYAR